MSEQYSRRLFRDCSALLLVFFGAMSISLQGRAQEQKLGTEIFSRLEWRNIGPAITSGRIAGIAIVENDPDIIYSATATGGAWKSSNRGTTWEPVFQNGGTASLGTVAVAPSNPNIVWIGAGESWEWRSSSWGDGVYKSEDGGKSWKHMGLIETRHIGCILIHPKEPNIVYVAGLGSLWGSNEERGLFKTTDGGKTWEKVLYISKYTGIVDAAMDPRDPNVLYAAAFQRERRYYSFLGGGPEGGIFKSVDGGKSWQRLSNGLPRGDVGRIGLSICRSQPDIIYAGISAREHEAGLYRSDDRGASWERRSPLSASRVRCDPNNPERVYLVRDGINASENGGKTFTDSYLSGKVHVDQHALWIDPNNSDHLVIGNDGGLYISFDRGRNWDFANSLPVTQFYTVAVDMQEPYYYVYGGTQDNNTFGGPSGTRNIDGIANDDWYMTVGGDGFYAQIDPSDSAIVYSESQYGRLVRFDTRTGERHLIQPEPPEGDMYRWNWSSPLLISHFDPKTLYFAANKLFCSRNRGDSWEVISPDLTRQLDHFKLPLQDKIQPRDAFLLHRATADYGNITTISESFLRPGLLAVGTDDGLISITQDNGRSWTTIDKFPAVPERTRLSQVALSRFSEGTIYATFDAHQDNDFRPYVIKSNDLGKTWSSITGDLPDFGSTHVIIEHPRNPSLLFVGTEFSLFMSPTGGGQWVQLKNNLPTVLVHDMVIHPRENDLVLGTHGRGFWILDDITILEELTPEVLSSDCHLASFRSSIQMHRFDRGRGSQGNRYFTAPNPPDGAIITYYVNPRVMIQPKGMSDKKLERKSPSIQVEILDSRGGLIRRLEPKQDQEGIGIQRLVWDLRHSPANEGIPSERLSFLRGALKGPFVLPGEYQVRLKAGSEERLKKVQVKGDPIINISPEDRRVWHDTLITLNQMLTVAEAAISTNGQIDTQVKAAIEALKASPGASESIVAEALKIASTVNSIRNELLGEEAATGAEQPRSLPIAVRIRQLYNSIEASTALPTNDQLLLTRRSHEKLNEQVKSINHLLTQILPELYHQLDENGIKWTPGRLIKLPPLALLPPLEKR